ncbi:MAG: homoserine dehydrogenase [Lentisphaerae bacterium]|nr:homoserine dehydrogenase [Lentisphaerota bacterium]
MKKSEIGVGLLGFGTVGGGVVDIFNKNLDLIEKRAGVKVRLKKIADLDITTDRGVDVDRSILTQSAESVVTDPSIDIIVELIGGLGISKSLISTALRNGKSVVTANKALLAEFGAEIFKIAEENGRDIFFEASVAGGIPVIKPLRNGLISDRIKSIVGILNGTCNYILSKMETDHQLFSEALAEAQAHGFAEADPALDIDGIDTAHKASVLASIAYGFNIDFNSIDVQGIRGLDRNDIEYAADLGYRIKMLAAIKNRNNKVSLDVSPALVPVDHILASVNGVFNAVLINGDNVGDVLFYGRGAGRGPTASAVVSDIIDAARDISLNCIRRAPGFVSYNSNCELSTNGDTKVRYYLRLMLLDKPGVFGKIGAILGSHNVSIASLLQKEVRSGDYVAVVITTHYAEVNNLRKALSELESLDIVGAKPISFPMEDFCTI